MSPDAIELAKRQIALRLADETHGFIDSFHEMSKPFIPGGLNGKPCPSCGKKQGELVERKPARFPFAVHCRACGWSTEYVKIPGVAEKLWNEAKAPKDA
jgi:hypothetical protein